MKMERKAPFLKLVRHYLIIILKLKNSSDLSYLAQHLLILSPPKFIEKLYRKRFFEARLKFGCIRSQIEQEIKYRFNDKYTKELVELINHFSLAIGDNSSQLGKGLEFDFGNGVCIRDFLIEILKKMDSETAKSFVRELIDKYKPLVIERSVLLALYRSLRDIHPELILHFADDLTNGESGRRIAASINKLIGPTGELYLAKKFLFLSKPKRINGYRAVSFLDSRIYLLEKGYTYKQNSEYLAKYLSTDTRDSRLANLALYFLHNSLPHDSGGYATRAHGLVKSANALGQSVQCVTRLAYPHDIKNEILEENSPNLEVVDGVTYHRLLSEDYPYAKTPLARYIDKYADAALMLAQSLFPGVLHAASNFMNGLVANSVGRNLSIPTVYEVRGLWEITRVSRQRDVFGSPLFRMFERLEAQAAIDATQVITITRALKQEMVRRGVDESKITILPNGVSCEQFKPLQKNAELAQRLNIDTDASVFGYIGSTVDYEGLDLLVEAAAMIKQRNLIKKTIYLIVGDGAVLESLKERSIELGVAELFRFIGRVPHSEVNDYYSLITTLVYPRKPLPVCEMVSPIKPLEAMAMEKTIIASNVDAIAEMIQDGHTGVLFEKGNIESLISVMVQISENKQYAQDLGRQARSWVIANRDWKNLGKILIDVYDKARTEHRA